MKNKAKFILDNAELKPEKVGEMLSKMHQDGETVNDILEFSEELKTRMLPVETRFLDNLKGKKIFDVCGTGGSGKSRINLSTALAIKLSENFTIAKHGNKAASGKVGSFDLIEKMELETSTTPESVIDNLEKNNLAFIFAPTFHPALKPLAPIRQSLGHPTIFNYLGPILNPVLGLTAQMTGVSSVAVGEKLAEACAHLERKVLFVHDTKFGLDDVSIGGATKFWIAGMDQRRIHSGAFFPEDYGFESIDDFDEISGGSVENNQAIFEALLNGIAAKPHRDFLEINQVVATEFFRQF